MNINYLIENIKTCNFTSEAGPLENNVDFQELVKMIEIYRDVLREFVYCEDWGIREDGHFGPCGKSSCFYCNEFYN